MNLYLSAYVVWPADEEARPAFLAEVAEREWLGGLELAYADSTGWPAGAPRDLPAIVTGIPGTAGHNAKDPDFGFASPDEAGRQRALDWARGEAAAIARMVGEGHRIRAVQLHSAPTGKADADAFAQSLLEMAGWDWGGAALWIEHCDAWVEGQEPNKGYLTLDQELAVLDAVSAHTPGVDWGMVINWARSAIEGRNAQLPLDHVRAAAAAGWLRHVGFSSCSGEQTIFGIPWIDMHLPLAGTTGTPNGTLLGAAEVADVVEAAGEVTYGLKIGLRPVDQSTAEKLAGLDENAAVILGAMA